MSIRLLDNAINSALPAEALRFSLKLSLSLKFNFQSNLTPSNISHLLYSISYSPP